MKWYKAPQEMLKAKRNDLKIFIFISIHYPLCWKRCVLAIGFKCLRNHPVLNGVIGDFRYLWVPTPNIIFWLERKHNFIFVYMHMYLFVVPSYPISMHWIGVLENQLLTTAWKNYEFLNFFNQILGFTHLKIMTSTHASSILQLAQRIWTVICKTRSRVLPEPKSNFISSFKTLGLGHWSKDSY